MYGFRPLAVFKAFWDTVIVLEQYAEFHQPVYLEHEV